MPDYSMGVEVDYHSNLRREPSSSSDIVSELAQGSQLIADPVEVETQDDSECTSWYAVEYRMTEDITLEGYICANLVHVT
jgi:hypothetical protein